MLLPLTLFDLDVLQWPSTLCKIQAIWLDHCGGVSTRLQQLDSLFSAVSSPCIIALTFSAHDSPLQVHLVRNALRHSSRAPSPFFCPLFPAGRLGR